MITTKTKRSKNAKGKDPVPATTETPAIQPIPFEDRNLHDGETYHVGQFAELSEEVLERAFAGTEIHPSGPDAAADRLPADYMSRIGKVLELEPDAEYAIVQVAERHKRKMYFLQSVGPNGAGVPLRAVHWGQRRQSNPNRAPEDVPLLDVMAEDQSGGRWAFSGKRIAIEVPEDPFDTAAAPDEAGFISTPPPLGQSQPLPLERITESPTNPRKVFRGLEELAASIGVHGLIQPITVRPVGDRYELVVGARRFRATKLAGLAEIPAIVRELSDQAVLEIQVIENDQREDVQPLDQAMGYKSLLDLAGYDVASLAKKIGQSESYVYRRLQLTKLIPEFQTMLAEETIHFGHALELSRLTEADQKELAGRNYNTVLEYGGHAQPVHRLRELIERDFHLLLSSAPWKKDDADLLPSAGACTTCPKRTGFNQSLFPDVEKDTCTDRQCFEAKREVYVQASIDKAKAKHGEGLLEVSSSWHSSQKGRLTQDQYDVVSAKEAKALPADQVKPAVVVEGDKLGKVVLIKLRPKHRGGGDDTYQAEERRRRQRAKVREAVNEAVVDAIVARLDSPPSPANWKYVARALFRRLGTDTQRIVVKRHGWTEPAGKKERGGFGWYETAAVEAIPAMNIVELYRFMVECDLAGHIPSHPYSSETGVPKELTEAAAVAGVDVKAIQAQVKAAAKEKKKPAGKGKPAKKAKAAARKAEDAEEAAGEVADEGDDEPTGEPAEALGVSRADVEAAVCIPANSGGNNILPVRKPLQLNGKVYLCTGRCWHRSGEMTADILQLYEPDNFLSKFGTQYERRTGGYQRDAGGFAGITVKVGRREMVIGPKGEGRVLLFKTPKAERVCRVCGCTEKDCSQCIEKTGEPCHWVEEDLCSACAAPAKAKRTRKAKVPA